MTTPSRELLAWVRDNPGAPRWWLGVAEEMARSLEMKQAWPSLKKAGAKPVHVFAMVTASLEESGKDVCRKPAEKEKNSIKDVRKAANELLKALKDAQLLGESVPIIEIGKTLAAVSWTDRQAGLLDPDSFAVVSLPDLLRGLVETCDRLEGSPPTRAISRQTKGRRPPRLRSFARRLAFRFNREFSQTMPENIARIATAVFGLDDPVTGHEVSGFIEGSPLTG